MSEYHEHLSRTEQLWTALKEALFSRADSTVDLETPYQNLRLAVWFSIGREAGVAVFQILESHRRAQVIAVGRLPLPGVDEAVLSNLAIHLTRWEMESWRPGVQLEHDGTRLWKVRGTPSNHLPAWPAKTSLRRS